MAGHRGDLALQRTLRAERAGRVPGSRGSGIDFCDRGDAVTDVEDPGVLTRPDQDRVAQVLAAGLAGAARS